jgi:hypothetical protein
VAGVFGDRNVEMEIIGHLTETLSLGTDTEGVKEVVGLGSYRVLREFFQDRHRESTEVKVWIGLTALSVVLIDGGVQEGHLMRIGVLPPCLAVPREDIVVIGLVSEGYDRSAEINHLEDFSIGGDTEVAIVEFVIEIQGRRLLIHHIVDVEIVVCELIVLLEIRQGK